MPKDRSTTVLERNGYKVTDANAIRNNNPKYDLICQKSGVKFYVDVKGQRKLGSVNGQLHPETDKLFYIYVMPVDPLEKANYYILKQEDYNSRVREYYDTHPNQKTYNGFLLSALKSFEGNWRILPGWTFDP